MHGPQKKHSDGVVLPSLPLLPLLLRRTSRKARSKHESISSWKRSGPRPGKRIFCRGSRTGCSSGVGRRNTHPNATPIEKQLGLTDDQMKATLGRYWRKDLLQLVAGKLELWPGGVDGMEWITVVPRRRRAHHQLLQTRTRSSQMDPTLPLFVRSLLTIPPTASMQLGNDHHNHRSHRYHPDRRRKK